MVCFSVVRLWCYKTLAKLCVCAHTSLYRLYCEDRELSGFLFMCVFFSLHVIQLYIHLHCAANNFILGKSPNTQKAHKYLQSACDMSFVTHLLLWASLTFLKDFLFKTKSYLFVYRWFNRWFIVAALRMLFQLTFMCTLYLIYLSRSTKRKEMTAILYDTFCKTAFRESGATF